jgi:medium-chain acyl-[acyl-carrier-protein] hydrolase
MNRPIPTAGATRHQKSRLLLREQPPAAPLCRLVCFPYAGGSAAIYRGWQAMLGPGIEVVAVELPGHGTRFSEEPVSHLDSLVAMMFPDVSELFDLPVIFFGHSNGALIAYVLAQLLYRSNGLSVQHLVLSAKQPPHLERRRQLHRLDTAEFLNELHALAGTPPEVLANSELMELMLPMLRADFALGETYVYPPRGPLPCSATLVGGTRDSEVSVAEVGEWAPYVDTVTSLEVIEGSHFYIHHARDELLDIVRRACCRSIEQASPDARKCRI